MNIRQVEISKLVEKYLHDTATKEETEKLFLWYRSEMNADSNWDLDAFEDEEDLKLFILSKIDAPDLIEKQAPVYRKFYYLVSAASLAIFMAIGLYFYTNNDQTYVAPTTVKKLSSKRQLIFSLVQIKRFLHFLMERKSFLTIRKTKL